MYISTSVLCIYLRDMFNGSSFIVVNCEHFKIQYKYDKNKTLPSD